MVQFPKERHTNKWTTFKGGPLEDKFPLQNRKLPLLCFLLECIILKLHVRERTHAAWVEKVGQSDQLVELNIDVSFAQVSL